MAHKSLYPPHIMQYYTDRARYQKEIMQPTFSVTQSNSLCGDQVTMAGVAHQGVITELSFSGSGCIISQAAAAMLIHHVMGKTVEQAKLFSVQNMLNLFELPVGPNRQACVLLALKTLQLALRDNS